MHLKPTAGCRISTLKFGFGDGGFPVHMKPSHQSSIKCKYRLLEKYCNRYYENKHNKVNMYRVSPPPSPNPNFRVDIRHPAVGLRCIIPPRHLVS
jgi:hypothetical protein